MHLMHGHFRSQNWSPPQASPIQSPVLQQDPRQSQYYQHPQAYAYQPMMQPGPLLGQFQPQPYQQPPPMHMQQQPMPQQLGQEDHIDTIPTAIVIKNIPFSVKRDSLLAILDNLDIPKPYAFNYHFDNGIFRGLAFANYRTAEEADMVFQSVNGFEVSGRKLRVEYKKVMPAAEQEKRDQEKAAAAALAAQDALQRREMEIMEAQMMEQQQQQQERQERQRELMELQSREFDRTRNRASAALLERRDSGRSLLDRDESVSNLNQLDLNDGETLAFYDRLLMFRGDATKDDMIFPENLSARQRRILHLIADKLSLHHYIEGEGNLRRLIIMKTAPPASAVLDSAASLRDSPGTPTKQRPMSYAGRGSIRSESPIYKSRSPLPDIPSAAGTTSTYTTTTTTAGTASSTTGSSYTANPSTTRSTGSVSPTRSLYRRSMVFDASSSSTGTNGGNLIYPIRQPKGPEPGKMFTIRDQKELRDATMIKPAFF
ncbi:MAG: hypothetical protein J3R72DRAFT_244647 [Linnemannia gamsii]|nr:MAG: hypothetical protein J3R72DRAFT_244647 [Linnemannia gamsii]